MCRFRTSPVILRSWSNHILQSNMWTTSNDQLPMDRIDGSRGFFAAFGLSVASTRYFSKACGVIVVIWEWHSCHSP